MIHVRTEREVLETELRLTWDPLPGQAMADQYIGAAGIDAMLLSGGFGGGKSYWLSKFMTQAALENMGCDGALVSPSFRQMERSALPTFLDFLDERNIAHRHYPGKQCIDIFWVPEARGKKDLTCRCYLATAERPDSIKGCELAWAGMDEPGLMPLRMFLFILSRLRENQAAWRQAALAGTPEDIFDCPWLPEMFVEPETRKERYITCYTSTQDNANAGNLPEGYIETMRAAYPQEMQRAYLDGEFLAFKSGLVYSSFTTRLHASSDAVYNPALPLYVMMDFNVDPMCWIIAQPKAPKGVVCIDEIYERNTHTEACMELLLRRYPPEIHRQGVIVYGDATGAARKTSATQTDYQIVGDYLGRYYDAGVRVPKSNPREWDRVRVVNNCFEKGWVDINGSMCPILVRDLVKVPKKEGRNEIDYAKDASLTHASSALGYGLVMLSKSWGVESQVDILLGKTRRSMVSDRRLG